MIFLVIALVVLIFGLLVFVHELGHFVAARRNGVEVEEFGFGFPPRLFGKKVGKTHYSVNWIPLGGFVKLKGEDLNDTGKGSFGASSFWAKTKILFAGVTMNAALAYLILLWLCLTGLPPLIANQFSYGQPIVAQSAKVMAVDVTIGSPAADAGITRGSVIANANGTKLATEQQLLDFTKTHAGQTVILGVEKGGKTVTKSVTLRPPGNKDGYLGVTPFATTKTRYSPIDAVITAGGLTVQLMWATLAAFGNLVVGLFAHGRVSDQVAGPVGIVVILANIVNFGTAYVLVFVASISISLAVINALPLPALDGGRWLLAAAQRVTKRQLSPQLETGIHAAGFFALIALMLVVTFFDIKRLG